MVGDIIPEWWATSIGIRIPSRSGPEQTTFEPRTPCTSPKCDVLVFTLAMYRSAHIVFVAFLLAHLEFAGAQGMPENITVDSVLTMAKEAAESGTTE